MQLKIKEFIKGATDEILFSIRCLCGKPSPMKRLIMVVVAGSVMGIVSICILVSSVYHIGYTNAQKEIPEINFIRQFHLKNDSINLLKQQLHDYEHEQ